MSNETLLAGTTGRVKTHHKGDGDYSARARLLFDCRPGNHVVIVELLDDFYCLEAGERMKTARRLFTGTEGTNP